jgi:hypothetical protein
MDNWALFGGMKCTGLIFRELTTKSVNPNFEAESMRRTWLLSISKEMDRSRLV